MYIHMHGQLVVYEVSSYSESSNQLIQEVLCTKQEVHIIQGYKIVKGVSCTYVCVHTIQGNNEVLLQCQNLSLFLNPHF